MFCPFWMAKIQKSRIPTTQWEVGENNTVNIFQYNGINSVPRIDQIAWERTRKQYCSNQYNYVLKYICSFISNVIRHYTRLHNI